MPNRARRIILNVEDANASGLALNTSLTSWIFLINWFRDCGLPVLYTIRLYSPIKKNHTMLNLPTEVATRLVRAYQSIALCMLYLRIFWLTYQNAETHQRAWSTYFNTAPEVLLEVIKVSFLAESGGIFEHSECHEKNEDQLTSFLKCPTRYEL